MSDPFDKTDAAERIVYIRSVDTDEIPEARANGVTADHVYAIHDASGNRLAVLSDRGAAFIVARQNQLTPVSVH